MWAQILNVVLGIWLMAAPAVMGTENLVADNDHVIGPLIGSCAFIALSEATRGMRWCNVPLGLWLLAAPWVLGYDHHLATLNDMVVGAAVVGFSFVKGNISERFGGGWSALFSKNTNHAHDAQRSPNG